MSISDNQGLKQASFRAISGESHEWNGDFMAAAIADGIAVGEYNGMLIQWLQLRLSSTETSLDNLKQEFAESLGAYNWQSIGAIP